MIDALKIHFDERRNKNIVSLMKYLHGSNTSRDETYEGIAYSSKTAAIMLARDMFKRLFDNDAPAIENDESATVLETLNLTTTHDTSSLVLDLMLHLLEHLDSRNFCRHYPQFSQHLRAVKGFFLLLVVFQQKSEIVYHSKC